MNTFEKFIKSLSDHELAKLIGYRYDEFMSNSKEILLSETQKRNLDKKQLIEYFEKPFDSENYKEKCPRCGSDRLFAETDYEQYARRAFDTVEVTIETNRCRICNYNPLKRKPKNLLNRISLNFQRKQKQEYVNWDIWDFF